MTHNIIIWAYIAPGILTLIFQVVIRLRQCTDIGNCLLSLAKAVVWSIIWPAYWVFYLGWV